MTSNSTNSQSKAVQHLWISIFFAVILSIIGILGFSVHQFQSYMNLSDADKVSLLWKRDIEILKREKHLPQIFDQISEFEFFHGSHRAKKWMKDLKVPFEKKQNGSYVLEILVISIDDKDFNAAVIQMDVIDKKSQNLIYELGRTYQLP